MKPDQEILLVTALSCEARPLIDHFHLKRDLSEPALQVYGGEHVHLVVAGVGKLPAAVATASQLVQMDRERVLAVNLGVAGATGHGNPAAQPKGTLSRVHRIVDAENAREYFPDLLPGTDTPDAALTTVPRGLTMAEQHTVSTELVDMEAAGFFVAAANFLPPHRLLCLKIVSDNLEPQTITPAGVEDLIQSRIPAVNAILETYRTVLDTPLPEALSEADQTRLEAVAKALRLTVSQSLQLADWARTAVLHGRDLGEMVGAFTDVPCNSKAEGKRRLDELRRRLGA